MVHLEIERRFLIDARGEKPWRRLGKAHHITQYYLEASDIHLEDCTLFIQGRRVVTLTENEMNVWHQHHPWTVRLRCLDGDWILTCKSRRDRISAYELEWDLNEIERKWDVDLATYPHIIKTRYVVYTNDGMWEVDEFESQLAGLVLAEIELDDANTNVDLPSWVGQEITGLDGWSNKSLAQTLSMIK